MKNILLLIPTLAITQLVGGGADGVSAKIDPALCNYQITGPGIEQFQAGFSATVEIAGQRHVLASRDGDVSPKLGSDSEQTPYGRANIRVATVSFTEQKLTLQLRLGEIPGQPCVLLQPVLQNLGTQPVKLISLAAMDMPSPAMVLQLPREGDKVWLEPRAAVAIREGHGKCQANRSTDGNPISIAGKVYARGLGTHARSEIEIPLGGAFKRFHAFVGLDDEKPEGSVGFEVMVDGQKRFDSGVMKRGQAAKAVDVDVTGAKSLLLVVNDGGDGITCDHADWAGACLIADPSVKPSSVSSARLAVAGSASEWLVTAYDQSSNGGPPNHLGTLAGLEQRMNIHEYGSIYRHDGAGFLFGPAGEPVAYLKNRVSLNADGSAALQIVSEMSGIRVDPGETRVGQQAVLWMQEPRIALVKWADWVAQTHHARTNKGALAGWCSWYHLTSHVKGSDVLGIVDAVKKHPDILRPQVIQIDDGYQNYDGVWDANAKFPEGMPYYARRIAETGARPGLWMALTIIGKQAPWLQDTNNLAAVWNQAFRKESDFRPDESGWIDPTHPRAIAHITNRVRHAVQSGFTYLKLDFNNIGNGGWYEQKRTSFQILRDHYTRMREAAGENTYILACITQPERAVVGLVDANRSSHDAHRGGVRSAVNDVLRCYQINNRWFAIDNDIYYLAPDVPSVGNVEGGWDLHRTWLSLMGLSSGAALTSDPWHWPEMQPHWRTVELMQPPAKERAEVLDLGVDAQWPRVVSRVKRPWGHQAVAVLWNPSNGEKEITLNFADAGLAPAKPHAVWSFWDNKYLGLATNSWTTPKLAPNACQHLVLTPVDPADDKPVLIGSSLHIHSGAAEIQRVKSSAKDLKITLTDAGARDGDLVVYSKKPLTVQQVQGCNVAGFESVGDHVWQIRLRQRQTGKAQSVTLGVLNAKSAFTPGQLWRDDQGVHINAHGGGILFHQGVYYWFGEHKIEGAAGNVAHVGVHVYSSRNLYQWKDEGIALRVADDPQSDITKGCVLERPKVIFNAKTGKFVMWFHLELKGQGYSAARSGVAVADRVTGPYRFLASFRPNAGVWPANVPDQMKQPLTPEETEALAKVHMPGSFVPESAKEMVFRRDFAGGQMARDMTLFVDDDGKAYHLYASEENATLHISQLSDDFLRPSGNYIRVFPLAFNEAPAVFKRAGKYYLFSSGCTGWAPNAARLAVADSIWGPWQALGNPCVGPEGRARITFDSQSTFVLPVSGRKNAFIFMADRWRPDNAIDGRYVWLPVQFDQDGKPFLAWLEQWDLNFFKRP